MHAIRRQQRSQLLIWDRCCLQVSAYSSPFAQQPYGEEEQGQGEAQPLLRSPSQLPSTAPSTSDVKLNVIPEHELTNEDAATGPSASQESIDQVLILA